MPLLQQATWRFFDDGCRNWCRYRVLFYLLSRWDAKRAVAALCPVLATIVL